MTRASTPAKRRSRPSHAAAQLQRRDWVAREIWLGALVIAVAALIAYIPAMRAGYVWDDPDHVSKLAFAGTWSYLKWIWARPGATPQYYPLTHTTFWIEYHLWGLRPAGYHTVNVLLHIANALLLWRILRRLGVPGAWLAAAVFAVHPVHVESVAWVTERKNTLSGFFYLLAGNLALTAWNLATPSAGMAEPDQKRRRQAYFLCLGCFLLAVLSKTVASTFPAAVMLVILWKRRRLTLKEAGMLLPFFGVALGMARLTSGMEKWSVGVSGPDFDFSPWQRVLIAGRAVWFYAGKLALPIDLTFIYRRWVVDPHLLWQWSFPVAAVVVIVALWLARKRLGAGPLAAVLFFVGTLFPALGFINVYPMRFSFVADHFQYLGSIGLIALGAAVLWKIPAHRARAAVAAAILLTLGGLSFVRARAFHDEKTLWYDTLRKNPDCWLAMGNLGADAASEGHYEEAIEWSKRSLRAFPNQPEGHLALAEAYSALHRWDDGLREYQAAVAVNPDSRGARFQATAGTAALLARRGDLNGAAREYEKAMEISPSMEPVRLAYCNVLQKLNRPQEAIDQYAKALEINPESVAVRSALAELLLRAGYLQEAMRYTAEAIELRPDARLENNYGVMLMQAGRTDAAAEQFSRAIATDPKFADAYDGLGYAREAQGRFTDAESLYRKAIELNPDFRTAQDHLRALQSRMH